MGTLVLDVKKYDPSLGVGNEWDNSLSNLLFAGSTFNKGIVAGFYNESTHDSDSAGIVDLCTVHMNNNQYYSSTQTKLNGVITNLTSLVEDNATIKLLATYQVSGIDVTFITTNTYLWLSQSGYPASAATGKELYGFSIDSGGSILSDTDQGSGRGWNASYNGLSPSEKLELENFGTLSTEKEYYLFFSMKNLNQETENTDIMYSADITT